MDKKMFVTRATLQLPKAICLSMMLFILAENVSGAEISASATPETAEAKVQTGVTAILLIAGGIISILTFLLFRERQRNKKGEQVLQQTKQQLIQQEKLASLGALTAGIAHEIKNPLNFVNNFSALSNGLIDDLALADSDEERNEILTDLKLNLAKINEHGKRADSIIRNMLQHSRDQAGEKQPTDINNLCEEYIRLSYHGMRSSHPTFNCTIDLQPDLNIPEVNIITQDFGRVLLNLFNNAFYAVFEKAGTAGNGYVPTVVVKSGKEKNMLFISIRDNGKGIPDAIKDKIFEPFFTTKRPGEGTGLGLSISHEIIKGHGGSMHITSVEGEFTNFEIRLPLTP